MRLIDPARIRAILETDRAWAAYALGDLAPGHFERAEWWGAPPAAERPALVLLYRAFDTPVLLAVGPPAPVDALLDEIGPVPRASLSIRTDILPLILKRWRVEHAAPMWRMLLAPASFRPRAGHAVERLSPEDVPALERLYRDGDAAGEAPDFFSPAMVADGVFCGVREAGEWAAVAGTHLVAPAESVAAVGNVYTRRDRRGRGLAASVASAVAAELLRRGIRTVVLNVNQQNAAALRVYESLGFARYCGFYEGLALSV